MVDELKKIKRKLGLPEYMVEDIPEIITKQQLAKSLGGRFTDKTLVVRVNKFWVIEIFGSWQRTKKIKDLTLEIYNTSRGHSKAEIFITYNNIPTFEEAYLITMRMKDLLKDNFEDYSKNDTIILADKYNYNSETGEYDDVTNPIHFGTDTSEFDRNIPEEVIALLEESKRLREETRRLLKEGLNG